MCCVLYLVCMNIIVCVVCVCVGSVCKRGILITKSGTVDQDTCNRLWVVSCVDFDVSVCGCVYVDVCL